MTVDIRSSDQTLPRFGTDFIATVQSDQHTNGALPTEVMVMFVARPRDRAGRMRRAARFE